MLAIWLLCLLAGSSCAVFYTKSSDNDYPRIGRRAFFTGGVKGSSYPRIGRSSPSDNAAELTSRGVLLSGIDDPLVVPSKRGIFTAGGRGFPRIGRAGDRSAVSQHDQTARSPQLSAAVMTSLESGDVLGSEEEAEMAMVDEVPRYPLPLGLLFFDFDKNGDKTLSREEFVQGMSTARREGTVCR